MDEAEKVKAIYQVSEALTQIVSVGSRTRAGIMVEMEKSLTTLQKIHIDSMQHMVDENEDNNAAVSGGFLLEEEQHFWKSVVGVLRDTADAVESAGDRMMEALIAVESELKSVIPEYDDLMTHMRDSEQRFFQELKESGRDS